jgi:hypothetical protein
MRAAPIGYGNVTEAIGAAMHKRSMSGMGGKRTLASRLSYASMTALAITIALSFILGCLTSSSERCASRFFNMATVGGAFFYVMALTLALGTALFAIALIGIGLGTYTRENDRAVLGAYIVGFSLLTLLIRWRSSRR